MRNAHKATLQIATAVSLVRVRVHTRSVVVYYFRATYATTTTTTMTTTASSRACYARAVFRFVSRGVGSRPISFRLLAPPQLTAEGGQRCYVSHWKETKHIRQLWTTRLTVQFEGDLGEVRRNVGGVRVRFPETNKETQCLCYSCFGIFVTTITFTTKCVWPISNAKLPLSDSCMHSLNHTSRRHSKQSGG